MNALLVLSGLHHLLAQVGADFNVVLLLRYEVVSFHVPMCACVCVCVESLCSQFIYYFLINMETKGSVNHTAVDHRLN